MRGQLGFGAVIASQIVIAEEDFATTVHVVVLLDKLIDVAKHARRIALRLCDEVVGWIAWDSRP
jgi:hypothetical protein